MRAIDYFDKGAEAYADRTAIIDGDSRFSYRELKTASESIAGAMSAAGIQPESPVAIYSPNDARVLFCMLGLLRAGGVWVPINYRNAADANIEYLNYVEASWLFYHSSFRDSVREIKSRVPSLLHCICIDAGCDGDESLEAFMRRGSTCDVPDRERPGGDDLMGPSGGTPGPCKG
jgi:acyl-CoA synthetase (AMP-forming)/AMP-acid ligase II